VNTATFTPSITRTSTITQTPTITTTFTPIPTPCLVCECIPIAYPQPAKNSLTFGYALSTGSSVKVYVYNLMGTQVAVFENAFAPAGTDTFVCDVSKFPPGMYFYIIKAPDSGSKFKVAKFMVER
jgi:hypothetical protein